MNVPQKISIILIILFCLFICYDSQKRLNIIKKQEQKYLKFIVNNPTKTKEYYDYTENDIWNQIQHKTILENNIINQDNSIIYLFWTGGFDSTFRLTQLLKRGVYVQPIYIMCPKLDSIYGFKRKNVDNEIQTMKKIRKTIYYYFSSYKKYFLPTRYVKSVYLNVDLAQKYIKIGYLKNFTRGITQYERLAQYSYYHPRPIELGLEKCGTGMDRLTKEYRIGSDIHNRVDLSKSPSEYVILKNLRFPISNLTKQDMVEIGKKDKIYFILKMTWSCWFPKNGKPCGKCNMCNHRIIPHQGHSIPNPM
jgi:hypothetical protein